ncbi:hypothetical protein HT102_01385 [Hoyosella sp. G463]|uniref:Uncharacterized protein n=1 Tax=Lolliginicoccus lacisalsi TaxID=2742202 RepID=A0A927PK02_9ACTN|nr:hypothetical protein [Lolliginicoccus lacisalsi]MBD8505143.1 hypothetical protein [Lolliginicoccus lacisalsi]
MPARADARVSAADLGFGEGISFFSDRDAAERTIPVPDGMRPEFLEARATIPPDAARAVIEVHHQDRMINRTEFTPAVLAESPVIRLPLAGVEVIDGSTTVELVSTAIPERLDCFTYWDRPTIALQDISVQFAGEESPPETISGFLPPVLDRAVLALPPDPTIAEIAAATELSLALAHRYQAQGTRVEIEELPARGAGTDLDNAFLARRFVLEEAPQSTIVLQNAPGRMPTLRMTGSGPGLETQARVLTSTIAEFLVAPAAQASGEIPHPLIAPEAMDFPALGLGAPRATAVGRVRLPLFLDQTRMGGPISSGTLRLLGTYTPLSAFQGGQITVTSGDAILDHWPMDESGSFDRNIELGGPSLDRYVPLTVTAEISGASLECGLEQPVTLAIDPRSSMSITRPDPIEPTFASLPQGLLPTTHAGLATFDLAHARRLISIATGLQSLSATPLSLRVGTIEKAMSTSGPRLVIGASDTGLPLRRSGTALIAAGPAGPEARIELVPAQRYGSLQVALDDGHLTLATDGDDEAIDGIVAWLESDPNRWFDLTGNVLAAVGDDEPRSLSIGLEERPGESDGLLGGNGLLLVLAGIGAATIGLLAALGLLVRRRSRR